MKNIKNFNTFLNESNGDDRIVDKLVNYFKKEIKRGNLSFSEIDENEIIAGANRIGIRTPSDYVIDQTLFELEDMFTNESKKNPKPGDKGLCEVCKKKTGEWTTDPYALDVRNEEEWMYLCDDCYHELVMDI